MLYLYYLLIGSLYNVGLRFMYVNFVLFGPIQFTFAKNYNYR